MYLCVQERLCSITQIHTCKNILKYIGLIFFLLNSSLCFVLCYCLSLLSPLPFSYHHNSSFHPYFSLAPSIFPLLPFFLYPFHSSQLYLLFQSKCGHFQYWSFGPLKISINFFFFQISFVSSTAISTWSTL